MGPKTHFKQLFFSMILKKQTFFSCHETRVMGMNTDKQQMESMGHAGAKLGTFDECYPGQFWTPFLYISRFPKFAEKIVFEFLTISDNFF